MKEIVCDGKGIETEICIFRKKGFGCNKVNLRLPYNYCIHWKGIEDVVKRKEV